jgi:hypothetical protein
VEARYVDIVCERRVVWTETIREIDKLLGVNITTLEFQPDGPRTGVKVTVQVTSFGGPVCSTTRRQANEGSLANMAHYDKQ